jgi:hypothetical protein
VRIDVCQPLFRGLSCRKNPDMVGMSDFVEGVEVDPHRFHGSWLTDPLLSPLAQTRPRLMSAGRLTHLTPAGYKGRVLGPVAGNATRYAARN